MATCLECRKTGFGFLEIKDGKCPSCRRAAEAREAMKTDEDRALEASLDQEARENARSLLVTTEATIGDVERLGIVAAEAVLGMGLFKDIAANFRDVFGGRSEVVQRSLKEARELALEDLRVEAAQLGADAVIAVDIDYHSISTGSSVNMMIVAATGTAVRQLR